MREVDYLVLVRGSVENGLDAGRVVGDTIARDGGSRDVFDVDDLGEAVLCVGGWWDGVVKAGCIDESWGAGCFELLAG